MRIAHVTEAWNGGISTYVNTLIKHHASDHDIGLLYSPAQARSGFDDALYECSSVVVMPYESSRNPINFLKCARDIRARLRNFKPDIVHLHSTFAGAYGRVLAPEFPVVYCAHGWSFTEEDGAHKRFVYGAIERLLARRTGGIINISQREYENARRRGIDAPVMRAVLNGVDDVPETLPAIDFEPPKGKINLGFVGRLDPKKGFDLLHGFIRNHAPDNVHLTVIGEASRTNADYSNDRSSNITYLGWVDSDLIDAYLQKFDAMIVPSRHEGFGLIVIEAMRNSVPAIVARDTAMPEMVAHGHNGFVFDIANFQSELGAILSQIDKDALKAMGQNARKTYEERFNAARMAAEVMDVYEDVLERSI